jgi:hypothetical protein
VPVPTSARTRYDEAVNQILLHRLLALNAALALSLTTRALAQQAAPFFGGAVTGYDVEVGIIDAGAILDAQPVVSSDQRYVTINARPSNSNLIALQTFPVLAAVAGSGYVGGVDPSGALTPAVARTSPSDVDRAARDAASVLNQRGVYLLTPLK